MYYIKKTFEIAGSHSLKTVYKSKCNRVHGHNWMITVYCKAEKLNEFSMVMDFSHIKKEVHGQLDHQNLDDFFKGKNVTAEFLAKWICNRFKRCYKVEVEESANNKAIYVVD